jgi:hypothetical protein
MKERLWSTTYTANNLMYMRGRVRLRLNQRIQSFSHELRTVESNYRAAPRGERHHRKTLPMHLGLCEAAGLGLLEVWRRPTMVGDAGAELAWHAVNLHPCWINTTQVWSPTNAYCGA